jgi:beta-N-acetylhexosaminidase
LEELALGRVLGSFEGPHAPDWLRRLADRGLGGVVLFGDNIVDDDQVRALTGELHEWRTDLLIATDDEGGDVTRLDAQTGSAFPGAAALGAVDDVDATWAVAHRLGRRLRRAGIDLDLAPCADVNSDPSNPVIGVRSFGADPALVGRHVASFVKGLQAAGVGACLKHFPGHGDTDVDSHLDLPVVRVAREVLDVRELAPFRAGIAAGAVAVMTSHLVVPALDRVPATISHAILVDLLRAELGFGGVVVTDALDMAGISSDRGIPDAAVAALAAGADLLCLGPRKDGLVVGAVARAIVAAVRDGPLTEERLEDAARRTSTPVATAVSDDAEPDLVGVARRAIAVDGRPIRPARRAVVVTCHPAAGIAAGDVPWGIAAPLSELDPTVTAHDLQPPEATPTDLDKVLVDAEDRPLVVVLRDAARHAWQRAALDSLVRARPDAVAVEMGWPGPASPCAPEPATRITTFGASRVSGQAAARLLFEGSA